jgi:hypothetical protein
MSEKARLVMAAVLLHKEVPIRIRDRVALFSETVSNEMLLFTEAV